MNERIRELAEQAKAQHCDLGDASCFKRLGLVEAVVFKPEDLEKFAELIVRECAGLFPNVFVEIENEYGHTPVVAADYIKKHFGVEE